MAADIDMLIDRRQMRRRVTFWRVAAVLLLGLAALALLSASGALKGISAGGDHIARVEIGGAITTDRDLIAMLDTISTDDSVKAMLLSINSPGGTAVGGEAIFEAVRRVAEKKPVAASVDTLAASAGYMVAIASDQVFARRASIVGSIGVILQYPQVSDLLDKIGVEVKEVKSSPLKAEPSPFHPTSPEAERMLQGFIGDSYQWFVDLVAERRPFDRATALKLADGSIYSGGQGVENKLIDALGGEREAKAWLVEKAKLDDKIELKTWKPKRPDDGLLGTTALGRFLTTMTGLPLDKIRSEDLPGILPKRLFLDGVLAIWHE